MPYEVRRDFVGLRANPPNRNGRTAHGSPQLRQNYEEGSGTLRAGGEGHTTSALTEAARMGRPSRAAISPAKACSNMQRPRRLLAPDALFQNAAGR